MPIKSNELNLHDKLKILIDEMVDKELPLKEVLKEFEKLYIESASIKYGGNKSKIADALGIHRNTLHNLTKSLKIK